MLCMDSPKLLLLWSRLVIKLLLELQSLTGGLCVRHLSEMFSGLALEDAQPTSPQPHSKGLRDALLTRTGPLTP